MYVAYGGRADGRASGCSSTPYQKRAQNPESLMNPNMPIRTGSSGILSLAPKLRILEEADHVLHKRFLRDSDSATKTQNL